MIGTQNADPKVFFPTIRVSWAVDRLVVWSNTGVMVAWSINSITGDIRHEWTEYHPITDVVPLVYHNNADEHKHAHDLPRATTIAVGDSEVSSLFCLLCPLCRYNKAKTKQSTLNDI